MYLRTKTNRSGSTTVVVVEKIRGVQTYVKVIGTSSDAGVISDYVEQGRQYVREHTDVGTPEIDFDGTEQRMAEERYSAVESVLNSVESVLHDCHRRILDRVFDAVGFGSVGDDTFRSLVVARLSQPSSKRATVEYLKSHFGEDVSLHRIYRYLDTLDDTQRDAVQAVSVRHTMAVHGGTLGVLFYDVTTLYFEMDKPDDLRRTGFSKEGRHHNPQIVLGLLVSGDGCPLAYSINEGSKYEGHTMLPAVKGFVEKYSLEDFIVVADSGMMNTANIADMESEGYRYIVGARIRNMDADTTRPILAVERKDGHTESIDLDGRRLVVGYSGARAKRDASNRKKGVERLRKRYAKGTITKSNITQRGYNKFLRVDGTDSLAVTVDDSLIADDAKWDGLKGYVTNAKLTDSEVVKAYHQLYNVERSFRISKSSLEMRPMFHFTGKRIKAHVCICFVALKVYRELERLLKENKMDMSVDTVLSIANTVVTLRVAVPGTDRTVTRTLLLTPRQKSIQPLLEDAFWEKAKLPTLETKTPT